MPPELLRPHPDPVDAPRYLSLSRLTDPGSQREMLEGLPWDVEGICRVASAQTIHHNLLAHFGLSSGNLEAASRIRPPRLERMLARLAQVRPGRLTGDRPPRARLLGACVQESYFLVGLLRFRGIPARVRAGYFRNLAGDPMVTLRFWEEALAARGVDADLRARDSKAWTRELHAFTSRQLAVDHHIEHWIAEYWEPARRSWILLDANRDFLKAHSGIEVPFRLPRRYFEYAWEAWLRMRRNDHYDPRQHAEEPLDGPTHIRLRLLSDLSSLLNHDFPEGGEPASEGTAPFSQRRYADLSAPELRELDDLATLTARGPTVQELVAFYRHSGNLRRLTWEADPYSFLHDRNSAE